MKALKYGLTLVLGLSLSVCSARAFAQSSGQSQTVTPEHPNTLPEVQAPVAMGQQGTAEQMPDKGPAIPQKVEDLMLNKEYTQAAEEFEKFIKTFKVESCEVLYARMMFYARLMMEDMSQTSVYKAKRDACLAELEEKCPDFADLYVTKARIYGEGNPAVAIKWLDKAIELDPNNVISYAMRADALWLLQEDEKACADYKKAMEMNDYPSRMRYTERCANREADNK